DQLVAELVREAQRGRDVVRAVRVLVPVELAGEHAREGLLGEVAVERLALGLGRVALGGVVLRLDERGADDLRDPEARGRGLLLVPVDALRVLAERRLHGDRLADHLLVDGAAAPRLDRDRLAADRVAGARLDDGARHAADERVAEALVLDVDRVDRAQRRAVRVGHLVRVVAGPAPGLLHDAPVRARLG